MHTHEGVILLVRVWFTRLIACPVCDEVPRHEKHIQVGLEELQLLEHEIEEVGRRVAKGPAQGCWISVDEALKPRHVLEAVDRAYAKYAVVRVHVVCGLSVDVAKGSHFDVGVEFSLVLDDIDGE